MKFNFIQNTYWNNVLINVFHFLSVKYIFNDWYIFCWEKHWFEKTLRSSCSQQIWRHGFVTREPYAGRLCVVSRDESGRKKYVLLTAKEIIFFSSCYSVSRVLQTGEKWDTEKQVGPARLLELEISYPVKIYVPLGKWPYPDDFSYLPLRFFVPCKIYTRVICLPLCKEKKKTSFATNF